MLSKSSVVMMLLIATAASLVGISSIIYKPANVETQAQTQQQQLLNAGRVLKQQQAPIAAQQLQKAQSSLTTSPSNETSDVMSTVTILNKEAYKAANEQKKLDIQKLQSSKHPLQKPQISQQPSQPSQSPLSSMQQQKILQSAPIQQQSKAVREINMQALADSQLLDRIFPQIIKRMDGKTLATKVLPYLDISAKVVSRNSPYSVVNKNKPLIGSPSGSMLFSTAKCDNGETAVGGGFVAGLDPENSYVSTNLYGDNKAPPEPNTWYAGSYMKSSGSLRASVTCLTINVGLKNVQQPQQPPLPPPGRPPLQPPPGLR